ncbi:MAG: ATP-binding cassette domain-containing protein [Bdellovibrionaceae bacterium]|nr:ATP-binding cassette domain-containing protein [Pseudobdellovibrionaceae bacterium]
MIRFLDVRYSVKNGDLPLEILKGLSFEIQAGEKVAICGPSGSGKSTLLYIAAGLLQPSSGRIQIDHKDLYEMPDNERSRWRNRRLGFVFQQFFLFPRRTALENVLLSDEYSEESVAPERGRDLLARFGLSDKTGNLPSQLSGGQQQRVAIARALLQNPEVVFADEPTGALDSKSAKEVLAALDALHEDGRTVVVITHDQNVARECERILWIEDGRLAKDERLVESRRAREIPSAPLGAKKEKPVWQRFKATLSRSFEGIRRHRMRSFLTLLGITVGVAALVSLLTIGRFARERILSSYAELGIQNFMIYGYPNWRTSASDAPDVLFNYFDDRKDLSRLPKYFPEIRRYSPLVQIWDLTTQFGGRSVKDSQALMGISETGLGLLEREIIQGRGFSWVDMEEKTVTCVIGSELPSRLFMKSPVGEVIFLSSRNRSIACRVIGVMAPKDSVNAWEKPNLMVYMPFTTLQSLFGRDPWGAPIQRVVFEAAEGVDVQILSDQVQGHFKKTYGTSAEIGASSNSKLIGQMNRFLSIFAILMAAVGGITLLIGGVGVTNMMLVSVSERVREIGLRRALGARRSDIRWFFLGESIALSAVAGLLGVFLGIVFYESALWIASQLFPQVRFEWIFDPLALTLGLCSIGVVGIGAGLIPALKAERLQVIEALRMD